MGNTWLYHVKIQATAGVYGNTVSSKKQLSMLTDAYRIHPILKCFILCHTSMFGMKTHNCYRPLPLAEYFHSWLCFHTLSSVPSEK